MVLPTFDSFVPTVNATHLARWFDRGEIPTGPANLTTSLA